MAQTTTAVGGSNGYFAVSTDGSSWTDCSGSAMKLQGDQLKRKYAASYTPGTDTPFFTYGPLEPVQVTATIYYTKTAGESYKRLRAAHAAAGGTRMDVRWAAEGNTTGNDQWTSGSAKLIELGLPDFDASSAGPLIVTAKWIVNPTESTIP